MAQRNILIFVACFTASISASASEDSRVNELEKQVRQLQERVTTLETQRLVPAPKTAEVVRPGNPKDVRNWRRLKIDMSEAEVEALLGRPNKINVHHDQFGWAYGVSGSVDFAGEFRRVIGWIEP